MKMHLCRFLSSGIFSFSPLLIVAILFATQADAAMMLQSYSAKNHHRFYTGVDKAFIGDTYDSSGVGRGANRWATMISEHYFLSARHLHPDNGSTIQFFSGNDPGGASEDHVVASGQFIGGSDLWLGKLSTAPSSSIERYPILNYPSLSSYDNIELYNYGRDADSSNTSQRLGRNNFEPGSIGPQTVSGITGESFLYDYDNPGGMGADETRLAAGDSGGPSFSVINGEFALVGIHWFIYSDMGTLGSGDTFVPNYIADLNAAMAMMGESVTTVIPEPSSLILVTLLGVAMTTTRRACQ